MRDAVIVGAVRTPVARCGGMLAAVHPVDLSALTLQALSERTGLDPAHVDDVVWGVFTQVGEQGWNVARNAVLAAGWPDTVPGVTVDRQCGSSQQAVHFAAAIVASGQAEVVIAGGVESMTRLPMGAAAHDEGYGMPFGPMLRSRYSQAVNVTHDAAVPFHQGIAAEALASRWGLDRTRLDDYALNSHVKAATATDAGWFRDELVPVGDSRTDDGIRRDTSLAKLGRLPATFRHDGVITAGSASQISDGAAALAITSSQWAQQAGLHPIARIHTAVVAATDPVQLLTGPIPATAKALRRARLRIDDIGVFEVNEAFASVPLAWLAETGADPDRLNPRGGAIALGHPLGGSGVRIMTTMLYHMRHNAIRFGLQVMCEGGGMANATILELIA